MLQFTPVWERARAITPSDTNGTNKCIAVLCITAGNLVFNTVDQYGNYDGNITLAMTANTILPVGVATVTTASTGTYAALL